MAKNKIDIFGNRIPNNKKERDLQFQKIASLQRKEEKLRLKASLRNSRKRFKLNHPDGF